MKNDNIVQNKRQCNGGGIICWLICMLNDLLAYRILIRTFNSDKYIQLLSQMIVLIMKLNFGIDFYYQEDISRVHKIKKVQTFMQNSIIKVVNFPFRSPDLNIVEGIWKMISIQIYNGPKFNCKQILTEKVITTINDINMQSRGAIVNLYSTYKAILLLYYIKD